MSPKREALGGSPLAAAAAALVVTLLVAVAAAAESGGVSLAASVNTKGEKEIENGFGTFDVLQLNNDREVNVLNGGVGEEGAGTRRRALLATCPTGSEYDATTAACLNTCKGGQYRSLTATAATTTTTNATTTATVAGVCKFCPTGQFREGEDTVKDACRPCPVGSSNPRTGQIACVPCSIQGGGAYQAGAVKADFCKLKRLPVISSAPAHLKCAM
jgi:hypothetical protein